MFFFDKTFFIMANPVDLWASLGPGLFWLPESRVRPNAVYAEWEKQFGNDGGNAGYSKWNGTGGLGDLDKSLYDLGNLQTGIAAEDAYFDAVQDLKNFHGEMLSRRIDPTNPSPLVPGSREAFRIHTEKLNRAMQLANQLKVGRENEKEMQHAVAQKGFRFNDKSIFERPALGSDLAKYGTPYEAIANEMDGFLKENAGILKDYSDRGAVEQANAHRANVENKIKARAMQYIRDGYLSPEQANSLANATIGKLPVAVFDRTKQFELQQRQKLQDEKANANLVEQRERFENEKEMETIRQKNRVSLAIQKSRLSKGGTKATGDDDFSNRDELVRAVIDFDKGNEAGQLAIEELVGGKYKDKVIVNAELGNDLSGDGALQPGTLRLDLEDGETEWVYLTDKEAYVTINNIFNSRDKYKNVPLQKLQQWKKAKSQENSGIKKDSRKIIYFEDGKPW